MLQFLIPEAIPSHKRHINMAPIISVSGDTEI
jgi:hypothetical protein